MDLLNDVEERLKQTIAEAQNKYSIDLKAIAVRPPYPYENLIAKFGHKINGIAIRPDVRECWVGDFTNGIVFEDACGGNLGWIPFKFYE